MHRLAFALLVLAACGTDNDQRPLTVQYATEAILAPTCGAAQCHSTFTQANGVVLDTVEGARPTLAALIRLDSNFFSTKDPTKVDFTLEPLIVWITQTDPFRRGIGRMPYDAPMPNADIKYLERYIQAGAPGAACDPAVRFACDNTNLVTCDADWSFGAPAIACLPPNATGCQGGGCVCGPDYGDCDADPSNGCELQLSTDTSCGGCTTKCMGDKHCAAFGQGHLCQCADGSDVCDATNAPNTCTPLNTVMHCGACGTQCTGTQTCKLVAGAQVCQ
ncbi:MAG: hypothetical protein JWO36_1519 [Myxococcales bacterium]|nr:hypothetical protein [Myxococcales bacterium]